MPKSKSKSKPKSKGKGKSTDFLQDMLNAVDDPLDDLDMLDQEFDVEGLQEMEDEDEAELEREDIDEFMNDDDYIQDSEITELLNKTTENRKKLKTGSMDEMAQDMEDFDANLALTTGIGKVSKQAKKRLTSGEARLPPQVKKRLGEANGLYITKEYGAAIDLLQEIITDYPNAHQAWNTLGLVHEELGNKSKSMQLRMVAAHMCQEASLWKELGQKSVENDAIKQAIYCFSKALIIDSTDVDALWDRSFLFKQLSRNKDAIQGFQTLLLLMPHHFKVINELAQLFRAEGKTKEAIQLYENAIVYHNDHEEDEDDEEEDEEEEGNEFLDKLGYAEINMLSELYLMQNDYRRSLDTIKTGLRHVQHRQNETWWQDTDNDDEYFGDDESRTEFPIELRIRMGVCRIYLGKVDLATKHFEYLLRYPPTTYPDLHQDIAYAYFDRRHYDLALNIFQKIIDAAQEVDVDVLVRMGDCHREVGDLEAAIVFYVNVLDEYPDNLDVMMSLATVYEEQGKEEEALELVEYVMKKNREARRQKKSEMENQAAESGGEAHTKNKSRKTKTDVSLFDENQYNTKADIARERKAERLKEFEEKTFQIEAIFQKLNDLDEGLGPELISADRSLIRDYMRSAQEAWDDFRSTPAFYPSTRQTRYEGFYALRRQKPSNKYSVEREARKMANRLRVRVKTEEDGSAHVVVDEEEEAEDEEEAEEMKDEEERENQLRSADHFRNIPFDKWLRVIVRYSYMLSLSKRPMDAYEVLKRAADANVFYHNLERTTSIKIALMGCGIAGENDSMVLEGLRWVCNTYRFQHDPFPLYIAFLECGLTDIWGSSNTPSMKYLARNIRLIDALIANKRTTESDDTVEDDQPGLDEIKELDDAILTMNIEPSAVADQNMNRFYMLPPEHTAKEPHGLGYAVPEKPSAVLLSAFGHLLTVSKNHLGASLFFMRSYGIDPTDPVNTFCLGLSLIYTAMQRKSDNRHMQIMQGMMFMTEYTKLAGFNQETEYNLARTFHTLGLTHLAVPHYENVLRLPSKKMEGIVEPKPIEDVYMLPEEEECDDDDDDEEEEEDCTDLSREAAYNLHLIYVNSGAMTLAQIVLLKYCTV